jgi:hypothetical protein
MPGVAVSVRAIVPVAVLLLLAAPRPLSAQSVHVAPFIGYGSGGDLYEASAGRRIDADSARTFGATVDVLLSDSTSVTFLYSHQQIRVEGLAASAPSGRYAVFSVDRWHVGGTQDLESGRVRPFLAGSLRFSLAGGAGVKLWPSEHLGVRLEGRLYSVILDGSIDRSICGGGGCTFNVDVCLAWQAEFTAGVVVSF